MVRLVRRDRDVERCAALLALLALSAAGVRSAVRGNVGSSGPATGCTRNVGAANIAAAARMATANAISHGLIRRGRWWRPRLTPADPRSAAPG